MPANLTPQYFEAEKRYRQARDVEDRLAALQQMLSVMPKHKGTDRLRAELRTKIARLTQEAERTYATSRRGGAVRIPREGAGQVALVGLPNSGKSQLLAATTEATPEIGTYPFTTHTPMPGMMRFENIHIQLVDLPAITYKEARPWLGNVLKRADLLLILADLTAGPAGQVEAVVAELAERHVVPAGRESGEAAGDPSTSRAVIAGTKSDLDISGRGFRQLWTAWGRRFPIVAVSGTTGSGLDDLKRELYRSLDIIRVYTKAPGRKPELDAPSVLKRGATVQDAAASVHKDFKYQLKYALVWGSGKFDGQRVRKDHVLQDGDIIELHV